MRIILQSRLPSDWYATGVIEVTHKIKLPIKLEGDHRKVAFLSSSSCERLFVNSDDEEKKMILLHE